MPIIESRIKRRGAIVSVFDHGARHDLTLHDLRWHAMTMEHTIAASGPATVTKIFFDVGDQLAGGRRDDRPAA